MKKIFLLLILILLPNFLQADDKYWYVGGGLGYLAGDVKFSKLVHDTNNFEDISPKYSFDTFGGYNFTNWFALEGEVNYGIPYKKHFIDNYGGSNYDKGSFYNVFTNAVFKYTFLEKHTPFVKVGLGYSSYIDDNIDYNSDDRYYGLGYHFAIGYDYLINKNNAIGLSYNYYRTFNNNHARDGGVVFDSNTYSVYHSSVNIQYKYSFR